MKFNVVGAINAAPFNKRFSFLDSLKVLIGKILLILVKCNILHINNITWLERLWLGLKWFWTNLSDSNVSFSSFVLRWMTNHPKGILNRQQEINPPQGVEITEVDFTFSNETFFIHIAEIKSRTPCLKNLAICQLCWTFVGSFSSFNIPVNAGSKNVGTYYKWLSINVLVETPTFCPSEISEWLDPVMADTESTEDF